MSVAHVLQLLISVSCLWPPYVIGQAIYIFILWFLNLLLSFFISSPNLKPRLHDTAGCQQVWQPCWTNSCSFNRLSNPVCQTGLTTVLNEQLFVQLVVKPGCTTGCIMYTNIYPVVKPDWQQEVVSCKWGFSGRTLDVYHTSTHDVALVQI